MSVDGPHRGLDMPRAWKNLAKCAANLAYSADEVGEAFSPALKKDWTVDGLSRLCRKIKNILGDAQKSLFSNELVKRIDSLRSDTAGSTLAGDLLDYAIQELDGGHFGNDVLLQAAQKTLTERAMRGSRQVEEHYRRESTNDNAINVRKRLDKAMESTDMRSLAAGLIGVSNTVVPTRVSKKTSLDDGVSL